MKKSEIIRRLDIMLREFSEDMSCSKRSLADSNSTNTDYLEGYHQGRFKQADTAIKRVEELYLKITK